MPTGEEKASGSQDQPRRGTPPKQPNTNDNPESERPPKGKPGRPSNTQPTNNVRKDHTKNPTPKAKAKANPTPSAKAKAKANPTANTRRPQHDTDLINNIDLEFWETHKSHNYRRPIK